MPERIVRIAFRGLMVLNYQGEAGSPRYMEIGFLDARAGATPGGSHVHTPATSAVHIPRVITMENGVFSELFDLRKVGTGLGEVRQWTLKANLPPGHTLQQTEVTLRGGSAHPPHLPPPPPPAQSGRATETAANKEDFGWIIDLENDETHNRSLSKEISTARLLLVLKVEQGEFFTKLLSKPLTKKKVGSRSDGFGKAAAVTGLDIKFNVPDVPPGAPPNEASVQLLAGDTPAMPLLVTKTDPTTQQNTRVFEISNAPAEVFAEQPLSPDEPSHFHMYYDKLFMQSPPNERFNFTVNRGAPGPDPALCGVTFLGQRSEDL